jgi:hypothetical protein
MLAKPIDIEPELIGQLDLLDEVAEALAGADRLSGDRVFRTSAKL